MTLFHRTSLASLLLLVPLASCDAQPTTRRTVLPTTRMTIGNKPFILEIADTDAARQKGLMRSDELASDHGMIFVFNTEAPLGFWMKNVRFPLDIIYLDSKGRIVSIKQMKAFDTKTTPSDGPAQYAIELKEGTAGKLGLKPGDTLDLPKGLKAKD